MQSIAAQLYAAMVLRGWSVAKLLRESKLKTSRPSMSRKLRGKQSLRDEEISKLARALDVTIAFTLQEV